VPLPLIAHVSAVTVLRPAGQAQPPPLKWGGPVALYEPPALGVHRMSGAAARACRPARLVERGGASDGPRAAAELAAEVAGLPGALQSGTPELLVDFLATVFKEGDGRPAPGCARAARPTRATSPATPGGSGERCSCAWLPAPGHCVVPGAARLPGHACARTAGLCLLRRIFRLEHNADVNRLDLRS